MTTPSSERPKLVKVPPRVPRTVRQQRADRFGLRMRQLAGMLMPEWTPQRKGVTPAAFADLIHDVAMDMVAGPVEPEAQRERIHEAVKMLPITGPAAARLVIRIQEELVKAMEGVGGDGQR